MMWPLIADLVIVILTAILFLIRNSLRRLICNLAQEEDANRYLLKMK